jgi:DNA-binding GntR family transcriptional regulator
MKITDAEKAYLQIKKQIVTTELSPGAVISEANLMDELGLGRTPIREAIKQLQNENLVSVTPRRGMFVADIAVTDLLQIFEVRVELEALATRLAVSRITNGEIAELKRLAEGYKKAVPDDKEFLIDIDNQFHSLLAQATHNKFLVKDLEQYYNLSLRIWYLAINYTQPEDIDIKAHLEILAAIEAQDALRAEQRMRKHIEEFHKTIKQYI